MDALDNLTLRKRRDLLFNRNVAPYEELFGAMFVYQAPPPVGVAPPPVPAAAAVPPPVPPPVPPAAPPPTFQEELATLRTQYEQEAAMQLAQMRIYNANNPLPPAPPMPAAMPVPPSAYQGLQDHFWVRGRAQRDAQAAARRDVLQDSVGMSRNRPDGDGRRTRQRAGVQYRSAFGGSVSIPIPHHYAASAA